MSQLPQAGRGQMVFLHPVEKRTTGKAKKPSRTCAVPAVHIEGELNQRTLDRDEIDAGGRNGHARTRTGCVRPLDGNRCMLVVRRDQSHGESEGKRDAASRRARICRCFPHFHTIR